MSDLIVLWNAPQPKSYRRILFRYNCGRSWMHSANWKFNVQWGGVHFNVITPFLRLTKCNGALEVGLGNHFLEIGW